MPPSKKQREKNSSPAGEDTQKTVDSFKNDEPREPGFVERAIADKGGSGRKRLGFNVNEAGAVDWEGTQAAKRKEIIDAIKNCPDAMKALGQNAEEVQFTEKDVASALGFLNGINKLSTKIVLARFKKMQVEDEILDACFDNPDPETQKELVARGTRLANKYSTEWMRKYADEIFFAALYFKSVSMQVMACMVLQTQRDQAKQPPKPQPVNGGTQVQEIRPQA